MVNKFSLERTGNPSMNVTDMPQTDFGDFISEETV